MRICQRIDTVLTERGHAVTLVPLLPLLRDMALLHFDRIVVGASIRYGHHRPEVLEFLQTYKDVLQQRPTALFSVNVVARKPGKNTPATNPYTKKLLRRMGWTPALVDVFAGKLDYPRYPFWDRQIIRGIMLLTHGPTDPKAVVEFTDWARVDAFARAVDKLAIHHDASPH